ncbi:formate dehydrogenase accessory sulfurtransferase FdhD [Pseudoroseomonas wenyumeiae]
MMPGSRQAPRRAWRGGNWQDGDRALPEEVAVAFTYDGTAHAVMMATPDDLRDFAIGFSLTEGILTHADEVEVLEIVPLPTGIDLRFWLQPGRGRRWRRGGGGWPALSAAACAGWKRWPRCSGPCRRSAPAWRFPRGDRGRPGQPATGPGAEHGNPCGACGGLLAPAPRPGGAARGCGPPQRPG